MTPTINIALRKGAEALRNASIENPPHEARLLLSLVLKKDKGFVFANPERPINQDEWQSYQQMINRRSHHEPISRIRGEREFWSLPFYLSQETLDPRPDTEVLVEGVLNDLKENNQTVSEPFRILDLGTGTGCLLLSLLSELPNSWGLGVDLSSGAIQTAKRNATQLRLSGRASFAMSDWATSIDGQFDIIVSNPPYICAQGMEKLEKSVRSFDPPLALDGGADGLEAYRTLMPQIPDILTENGTFCIEMGALQAKSLLPIVEKSNLRVAKQLFDLKGIERGFCLKKQKKLRYA
ncbi:MAG: peptide chain release factor N(5)-glutamine methyltransferase [Alphaproteobacteria bacterium]|jgi:release factor glutamine methyltransferase|nr:peptide chain release factor N(5)-glutamine methyltransferase [Alphaproteobacteria bacterium]MBT5389735.1 peptide chain release factor N(5)-glutamine methyltransferase [Alphaproteobacteria bacterium]MBT5541004.1 peptide chain release factor N(5)-glutamine methyltransferase [Alphaproteobacteria bacterium]MBT5654533.1 peptide chain release factor N(5)-glutamine methyltransferase [Alphaproteobacteria bacterium]